MSTDVSENDRPGISFEEWRELRSEATPIARVELLRALAYGRLAIESEEGSTIVLDNFYVDNVGLCKTDVDLDIVDQRKLSDDVEYPEGLVTGVFFRDDAASVGESFQMVTYDYRTSRRTLANLSRVARLTICPHEPQPLRSTSNGSSTGNGLKPASARS